MAPNQLFELQPLKPGDRRNFNTHKTCWKCRINNESPTGKKHTTVGRNDGGKIGIIIIINSNCQIEVQPINDFFFPWISFNFN